MIMNGCNHHLGGLVWRYDTVADPSNRYKAARKGGDK
jgi:hypothetical protein